MVQLDECPKRLTAIRDVMHWAGGSFRDVFRVNVLVLVRKN